MLLRAPAPLTPSLALEGGTTLTPPKLVAATFTTVDMESRGSDGLARLAGRSFGEAAHSAAHGDSFGVFIYTFIGVIALAAVIVYILAGEDDGGDYKKSKLPPMFNFSF